MPLDQLAGLDRPRLFDILSALRETQIEDDASLDQVELMGEVAAALRDQLDAPQGRLGESLRRRLVEVGYALDLLELAGILEPPGDIDSFDLVSDAQLAWLTGYQIGTEAEAGLEGDTWAAERIGDRVLALPRAQRERLVAQTLSRSNLTYRERRREIEAVLGGDPLAVIRAEWRDDARLEDQSLSYRLAMWICSQLDDLYEEQSAWLRRRDPRPMPAGIVSSLAPAAAAMLSAFIVEPDRWRLKPPSGTEGTKASSPSTRARRARYMRGIAPIAIAAYAYLPCPRWPSDGALSRKP